MYTGYVGAEAGRLARARTVSLVHPAVAKASRGIMRCCTGRDGCAARASGHHDVIEHTCTQLDSRNGRRFKNSIGAALRITGRRTVSVLHAQRTLPRDCWACSCTGVTRNTGAARFARRDPHGGERARTIVEADRARHEAALTSTTTAQRGTPPAGAVYRRVTPCVAAPHRSARRSVDVAATRRDAAQARRIHAHSDACSSRQRQRLGDRTVLSDAACAARGLGRPRRHGPR